MKSLKFALSGEDSPSKGKGDVDGSLLKGVNKSKNQSMLAFDLDEDEPATEETLKTDGLLNILNAKLEAAFKRDGQDVSEVVTSRSRSPSSEWWRSTRKSQAVANQNCQDWSPSKASLVRSVTSQKATSQVLLILGRVSPVIRRAAFRENRETANSREEVGTLELRATRRRKLRQEERAAVTLP